MALRELDRMTFDEVERYLDTGPGIVIVPVGSTEVQRFLAAFPKRTRRGA